MRSSLACPINTLRLSLANPNNFQRLRLRLAVFIPYTVHQYKTQSGHYQHHCYPILSPDYQSGYIPSHAEVVLDSKIPNRVLLLPEA